MPLFGTLQSMPLPDLLQWLGATRKTGTLRIERTKISKAILLRDGEVIGCSSDGPPERLGQWLLARGKITEAELRQGLAMQEQAGKHLGMILVEMGALSPDELSAHLESKAEEVIYSLFDWDDAHFRFEEQLTDHANIFPVALRVEDVLLRGLKRYDEMQEVRTVFNDPGIILRHTARKPPPEILDKRMARTLYGSIDGNRSVAEILLHVHGSEFVVTKFLFELHRTGHLEIIGSKGPTNVPPSTVDGAPDETADLQATSSGPSASTNPDRAGPPAGTASTPRPAREPATGGAAPRLSGSETRPAAPAVATATAKVEAFAEELVDDGIAEDDPLANWEPEIDRPATEFVEGRTIEAPESNPPQTAAVDKANSTPAQTAALEALEHSSAYQLESRLEKARRLMSDADFEAALVILDKLYQEFPGDDSLRRLTAEAEAAFAEKAYRHYLPPAKVPILTQTMDTLGSSEISPAEFFLLSRIDGTWDVKSIVQIAPLREADVLRTLKRMREQGVIELRDPE